MGLRKVLSPLNITLTHKAKFLSRIYLIVIFFYFFLEKLLWSPVGVNARAPVIPRQLRQRSSSDPRRRTVAAKAMVVVGLVAAGAPVVVGGCNF